MGEFGKARAGHESGVGQQRTDQPAHGFRPHEQGLMLAARMQQPVGEHMPTLEIGAKLDLIHSQEIHRPIKRHGFDRTDEVLRAVGQDLFLARQQGHRLGTFLLHHPVIDLAGEQPERQANNAGPVTQHAFDGVVGLARIGGPEHSNDLAARGRGDAGGGFGHGWHASH